MKYFSPDVYAEVYEILSYIDINEVMKIPYDLLEDIKKSRNKNYKSKIDALDIYNRENVLPDTIKIIAALDLEYFSSNEEKKRLEKELNEELDKKIVSNKYNSEEIFKNKQKKFDAKVPEIQEKTKMVAYKEQKWYQKIFAKILNFFKFK